MNVFTKHIVTNYRNVVHPNKAKTSVTELLCNTEITF